MKFSSIAILVSALLGVALLFLVLIFGGSYLLPGVSSGISDAQDAQTGLTPGSRAPDFDLPDLSGDHVALGAYSGKPLVVLFFATWSEQSTDALHIVDEYIASHPQEASLASFVMIDSQEDKSVVASYIRRGGYQTRVLLDTLGKAGEDYAVKSLPTFYIIDSTGLVSASYSGVLSDRMLGDKLEQALK
jgi:hypothetical protein